MAAESQVSVKGVRVGVVGRRPELAVLLEDCLGGVGYVVQTVADRCEAESLLFAQTPDLARSSPTSNCKTQALSIHYA